MDVTEENAVQADEVEDADTDSSDGDDDEAEEKISKTILDIEKKLLQSPYDYQSHNDLIQALRKAGELVKLRAARANMANIFPLTQTLWLEWIEDEKKVADSEEDHLKIEELFEKAVQDYMCPEIWLEYCQYGIRWMGSAEGLRKIRDVMERAIANVGVHVAEGAALWEMYREFENALLLNMQPQPGQVLSKEEKEKIQRQMDKISSLFKGQLAIPLLDMEATFQEYLEWCQNEVDPSTKRVFDQSLKHLEDLKPLERALVEGTGPKLEQYQEYIQLEIKFGDPARIQCIYERALVGNCLNSELWLQYLKYMSYQNTPIDLLVKLHRRSVRNCPWTGLLWMQYLLALEKAKSSKEELNVVFEEALVAGFSSASEYVELWKLRCSQICRQITAGLAEKSELSFSFERATKHIRGTVFQAFGETGDANYTIWALWAKCEASRLGNKDKAIEILQNLSHDEADARRKLSIWKDLYDIERLYGGEDKLDKCRSILRQAVQNCAILPDPHFGGIPDAEVACEMLLDFERIHGCLEDMEESLRRVNNKLSRIAQRREKDAAAYAERQQKNKLRPQKMQNNKKEVNPRKRKSSDETQNMDRNGSESAKQQKLGSSVASEHGFKAPAGLPARYIKKAKPETSSSSSDPPAFKTPALGPKGAPPGFKPPSKDKTTSDRNNNEEKVATVQSSTGEHEVIDKKTVFVSNIDYKVSNVEEKLKLIFHDCGQISDVRLVQNNKGQFRGFGFVEFSSESSVEKALKLDRQMLDGRPLFISPNVDKKKQPNFKVFKYDLGMEKHKLFVSNLSFHTTNETLNEEFSKHGVVKGVRIVSNRRGDSKGIAYVEYDNKADAAQAVLKMDGKEIDGFAIKVAISNPPVRKLAADVPSLGGTKEQFKGGRGRGRTQLSLLPRSISRPEKPANGGSSQSGTSGGMTNKDFADMLLKR